MKKIILTSLAILPFFILNACNISNFSKVAYTQNNILSKEKTSLINLDLNTFLDKNRNFKLKQFRSANIGAEKLKLEVLGLNFVNTYSQIVELNSLNFNDSSSTFTMPLPIGKNRIIKIQVLDINNKVLATVMGVIDVLGGQNNTLKISYFSTVTAQILLNILNGSKPALLENLDLNELQTKLKLLTGFNELTNKYSKKDPLSLNTIKYADYLMINEGKYPTESESNLFGFGTINLNLNVSGVRVNITDPSSNAIQNTTSNNVLVNNISSGVWNLTLMKAGYKTISQEIKINANENVTFNINLEKLPLGAVDGFVGGDAIYPSQNPSISITPPNIEPSAVEFLGKTYTTNIPLDSGTTNAYVTYFSLYNSEVLINFSNIDQAPTLVEALDINGNVIGSSSSFRLSALNGNQTFSIYVFKFIYKIRITYKGLKFEGLLTKNPLQSVVLPSPNPTSTPSTSSGSSSGGSSGSNLCGIFSSCSSSGSSSSNSSNLGGSGA